MNKICIIGGGFGGLAAMKKLCKFDVAIDGILIDKKATSDFLPTLPDCLGRGIDPDCLTYKISDACRWAGFRFINEEVSAVDLEKKEILTKNNRLNYDYLIIASGSETNFYGNENIRKYASKLDDAEDADSISKKLKEGGYKTYIISGGGYTGVEVATNLRLFLNKSRKPGKIIIVERAPAILGPLPEWMKAYAASNLKLLGVDVLTGIQVEKIEERKAYISGNKVFDDALVIWAAGVKTANFIQNLNAKKNPQGRIEVDEYLRLNESAFVIGDAAYVKYKDIYLRMAVQFSTVEGERAASNIIKSIQAKPLDKYKPVDMGYIIPMANNKSCGNVFGLDLKGFVPTILHFMMCLYRSCGWRNRYCIIKRLLKGGP